MVEVRILNGLKAGISFPLSETPLLVGGDQSCDILLLDKGTHASKCSIKTVSETCISFHVIEGEFITKNNKKIQGINDLKLKEYVGIGGIWLQLAGSQDEWPDDLPSLCPKKPNKRRIPVELAVVLSTISIASVANFYGFSYSTEEIEKQAQIQNMQQVPAIQQELLVNDESQIIDVEPETPEEDSHPVEYYADIVKQMLDERELGKLTVHIGDGQLELKGTANVKDHRVLERMAVRYEFEQPNGPILLDKTEKFAASFPLTVVSVVAGPFGHVVLDDGTRIRMGQEHNGYRLKAIRANEIEFQGAEVVSVRW